MAAMRALCSMLWATIAFICPKLCSHNVSNPKTMLEEPES